MTFPVTSRYYGIETKTIELADGTTVSYLKRRFVPQPSRFATVETHLVTAGERPDHIAHQYLNDAEQFWLLCDANAVLNPDELTATVGRRIRITLPEGIPGNTNA
jgi:hypothetical protein